MKLYRMFFVVAAAVAVVAVLLFSGAWPVSAGGLSHAAFDLAPLLLCPVTVMAGHDLKALQGEHKRIVGEMRALLDLAQKENRELTAEEEAAYDGLEAQLDPLKKKIDRGEKLAAEEAALSAVRPGVGRRAGPVYPQGSEAAREFESLGQFMHAVRFNPNDQRLMFVEGVGSANEEGAEMSAEMRMDDGPSGGFMVPRQFREQIFSIRPQDALVRPRASIIPAGSPPDASVTMPGLDQTGASPQNVFGGVEVKWIGEGDDKPETDAKLREITWTPHEVAAYIKVTDKLLRNWQAAGAFIEGLLRGGIAAAEDYAFLRGNGVAKPIGVLNAGATKWVNRALANKFTYADSVDMVGRLLMRGGQPVWSMPQSLLEQLGKMKDDEGHLVWKANARDGFAGDLHGYPVRWNNRAPGVGSKGDVVLGDWSYYLIKDGSGPYVATSEHVHFTSNKTVIKIFYNVDGAPWLTAPFKEENGYEVSPFVGLDVVGG